MEIISGIMLASYSLERFLDGLLSTALFGFFPVCFVVFLILTIVQIVKRKKHGGKLTKVIVFGILAAVFAVISVCEVIMLMLIAAAVAHM